MAVLRQVRKTAFFIYWGGFHGPINLPGLRKDL